ncbi:stAR-related lipid transfer protein 7, mitochondrial isoform X1 [Falco rusticolus]|uniref:stAR-related lipid transfer protein 7, mitochondrial isoform X1 n=3 Tax=Falco TaxID=8952 RepID=UPI0018865B75|nr:stAR-related lipid transfer protein 7, mitochondrial isoform X1 [Falco rusticolus]XP_055552331.1 stAR-related lipid transfer protein 7, mitochondrial isoform X1 [Falco cherrug]
MLQPRRPLVGLVARCARAARLGPRPPGPAEGPPAAGGQAGGGAGRRGLLGLLARQCSCVTGQRARRARRAWHRGSGGDGPAERSRRGGGGGGGAWWWWRLLRARPAFAATGRLMATLAGVFVWDGQRIEEEELQRSAQEMKHMENISSLFQASSPGEYQRSEPKSEREAVAVPGEQPWEMIMDKKHFKLWRRPIEGTHLYQYRVFGSYTDVTPRQFFNVQLDTEYRKKWDSLVIKLDVIERDLATGSEVIHWVTHFPYPMYSRDYVYVRRYSVDKENNLMVLVSRAVEHPSVPEDPEYVRVRTYESQMVIRPHKTFDENGFDYLLTYSDNPQTVFPRYCVSWMVSSGMPDFLEKLHTAALKAKKMEIEVRDYMSAKPPESSGGSEGKASVAAAEHKSDGTRSPAQLEYA